MFSYIYKLKNGTVGCGSSITGDIKIDGLYWITDNIPTSPPACWDVSDSGEVVENSEKLLDFNRNNMPDLSRVEFKYKLHVAGKLEEVDDFINKSTDFLLKLAYSEAQFFKRSDVLIKKALSEMGWTEEQVDDIWTS